MSAVATRDGGAKATGVKHWFHFNSKIAGLPPVQHVDPDSPRWVKLEAEQKLCDFAVWLVVCKPTGRRISTKTARKYISQVQSWMRRVYSADIAGDIDLANLRDVLKGMRRELGDEPTRKRYGVRTQHLRKALDQELPAGSSRAAQAVRAALTSAFCGLLRGCEVGLPEGESFDPLRHLTRKDIRFVDLPDGRVLAVLTIHQAKLASQLTGKHIPVFLVSGGSIVDPVRELKRMLELDPVSAADAGRTPLFRDVHGQAFTRSGIARIVKSLMAAIGLDPDRFGAHSLRIGGATAALSAGVAPAVIRITGRWKSDVWMTYARLTRQSALRVSSVIGSTWFDDVERGEFSSEELELVDSELQALGDVDFGVDDGDSSGGDA